MNAEQIGQRIIALRTEKNMSQKELSERIGISASTLCKWEKGQNIPNVVDLYHVCDALEVPYEKMFLPEEVINRAQEKYSILHRRFKRYRNYSVILATSISVILAAFFLHNFSQNHFRIMDTRRLWIFWQRPFGQSLRQP